MSRIALLALFATVACGRPFDVKTPRGFVELDNQGPDYAYRATTADGVVVAVRAVDAPGRQDLGFWEQAVALQLRDASGYACNRSGCSKRCRRFEDLTAALLSPHHRSFPPACYCRAS